MKYGCCTNMIASRSDGLGVELIDDLVKIGYDYIELSLSHLMNLNDEEFKKITDCLDASDICCEANNNFFPASMKLTGNNVNMSNIIDYVKKGFTRINKLGSKIVVFGSAGAKNVPAGYSYDKAWEQIVNLLQKINPIAQEYGIIIAIEPLNRSESNIVNTVAEGLQLARDVNSSNIKLLVDFYHMMLEKENNDIILKAGNYIKHVHIAELLGRTFPSRVNESYTTFFGKLQEIGYNDRISIEAYSNNFVKDAGKTLSLFKQIT